MRDKIFALVGGAALMAMAIGIVAIMNNADKSEGALSTTLVKQGNNNKGTTRILKAEGKDALLLDCGKDQQITRCAQGYATPGGTDTADHFTLKEMAIRAFYGQSVKEEFPNVKDKFVSPCAFDHHGKQSVQFGGPANYNVLIVECSK